MEALPVSPYNAHAVQIQGQVDLLHALWNEPVFSLRNTTGQIQYSNLTFPELCKKHCGVQLPASPQKVSLEGWLLCLSMKDARAFGPYKYDKDSLSALLTMADDYWTALQAFAHNKMALSDVSHAAGFHLLCANCDWNADSQSFLVGRTSHNGTLPWLSWKNSRQDVLILIQKLRRWKLLSNKHIRFLVLRAGSILVTIVFAQQPQPEDILWIKKACARNW